MGYKICDRLVPFDLPDFHHKRCPGTNIWSEVWWQAFFQKKCQPGDKYFPCVTSPKYHGRLHFSTWQQCSCTHELFNKLKVLNSKKVKHPSVQLLKNCMISLCLFPSVSQSFHLPVPFTITYTFSNYNMHIWYM